MKYYISNDIQFIRGFGDLVDNQSSAKHVSRADAYRFISNHPDHVAIPAKGGKKHPFIITTAQKFIGANGNVAYEMSAAKSFNTASEAYEYLDTLPAKVSELGKPFVIDEKFNKVKRPPKPEPPKIVEKTELPDRGKRVQFSPETRKLIYGKTNICAICGKPITAEDFTIDHIVPLSRGGNNKLENLRPTHEKCNLLKGNLLDMELLNMIATIGANNLYNSPTSDLSARFIRAIVRGTIAQGGDIYRKIRMEN